MAQNHKICRVAAIVACLIVLGLSISTGRDRRTYEVDAQVYSVPGYQSDAARAINAYERLMQRHMDVMEQNLAGVAADIQAIAARLDAIDAGLTRMDRRLARIEKHLGIVPVPPPAPIQPDPNAPPGTNLPADRTPPTPP